MEFFVFAPSDGCPATANLLSLNASLVILTHVLSFELSRLHRRTPARPVHLPVCCTSVFDSLVLDLLINQGTQWFSGEPLETPRTRCSLRQSPLMTQLKQRAQTTKPKLENHKELPRHKCKLPLNQCNFPWTNACKPPRETEQLLQLCSDWSTTPVRPVC
jgi:hypothetical protein